ncbi:hypothetical protein D3C74_280080 [compost metagenome]
MSHQLDAKRMGVVDLAFDPGDLRRISLLRIHDEISADRVVGYGNPSLRRALADLLDQLGGFPKIKPQRYDFDMLSADAGNPIDHLKKGHRSGLHRLIETVRADSQFHERFISFSGSVAVYPRNERIKPTAWRISSSGLSPTSRSIVR